MICGDSSQMNWKVEWWMFPNESNDVSKVICYVNGLKKNMDLKDFNCYVLRTNKCLLLWMLGKSHAWLRRIRSEHTIVNLYTLPVYVVNDEWVKNSVLSYDVKLCLVC